MKLFLFLKKGGLVIISSLLLLGGFFVPIYAASLPTFVNYQGYITNSSGVAQSGTATVVVRVYDHATAGTLLFEENEGSVTITNGYFSIPIGKIGDINGGTAAADFSDLAFDKAYYVTVELGAPFSTGEMTLAGGVRSEIGAAPFSMISYGALTSATSSGLVASKGKLYFDTTDNLLYVYNGTSWNALGIAGSGITSLNGLSGATQLLTTTSSGSDITFSSSGFTHTLSIPNAGATARGVVSTTTQTFAGDKTFTGTTSLATTTISTAVIGTLSAGSLSLTNTTSTNFVSTNSTSSNSFISSLTALLASFTNLLVGNSTTTNATVTNLTGTSATLGTSTVTGNESVGGTLDVTGKTTLANASSTNLTATGILTVQGQTNLATASSTALTATTLYSTVANLGAITGTTGVFSSTLNVTGQTTLANASTTGLTANTLYSTNAHLQGFTPGSILFATTSGLISQNNTLFRWDEVDSQVEVGYGTLSRPSYSFGTDDNVGMYRPSTDVLALVSGGAARLHVTSAGVGIGGTSTPVATLSVLGVSGDNPFNVASSTGTSLFTILANGNVGIGSSTPSSKLSLTGTAGSIADIFTFSSSTGSSLLSLSSKGVLSFGNSPNADIFINSSTTVSQLNQNNTAIGNGALANIGSGGVYNIALGFNALYGSSTSLTTGDFNVVIGDNAGYTITSGFGNLLMGHSAGINTTTGFYNVFVGLGAGTSNTTGAYNTFFGTNAGWSNSVGSHNTLTGNQSGFYVNGNANVATGNYSLSSSGSANSLSSSTAIGYAALQYSSTSANTALGYGAGTGDGVTVNQRSTSDVFSMFLGYQASRDQSVASTTALTNSTAIGKNARVGMSNAIILGGTGSDAVNVGIGTTTPDTTLTVRGNSTTNPFLVASSTGTSLFTILANGNVGIGSSTPSSKLSLTGTAGSIADLFTLSSSTGSSLLSLSSKGVLSFGSTTGANIFINGGATSTQMVDSNSIAIGNDSYRYASTTYASLYNIAFGYQALYGSSTARMTGGDNVALGNQAGYGNTTGSDNFFAGTYSGYANTSGSYNFFAGIQSGTNNITGSNNIAVGYLSAGRNTAGSNNISLGESAAYFSFTGSNNIAIGKQSGYNFAENSSIAIGNSALYYGYYGENIAIGDYALYGDLISGSGASSTAVGIRSLMYNKNAIGNTALGYQTGVGDNLSVNMRSITDSYTTFVGFQSSRDSRVSSSVALTNIAAIGKNAKVALSNAIVLGGTSTDAVTVGIGTSTPNYTLTIRSTGTTSPLFIASSTGAGLLALISSGDLGIGTTTPSARLDVYKDTSATSTDVFRVISDVTSVGNVVFKVKANGDVFTDGATTIGTPADLAEKYPSEEPLSAGTVVAFSSTTEAWSVDNEETPENTYHIATVRKAHGGDEALGVISTRPGIILGGNTNKGVAVAFSGRVPVLVTDENGIVKRGDYLVISTSTPGYAMKATQAEYSIGRAISDAVVVGQTTVLMVVENRHRAITLSSISGLQDIASSSESFAPLTLSVYDTIAAKLSYGSTVVTEYLSVTVKAVAGYFDKLFAKEIYTDKVCLKKANGTDVCITGDQVESMLNATQIPLMSPSSGTGETGGETSSSTPSEPVLPNSSSTEETSSSTSENITISASSSEPTVTDPLPSVQVSEPAPTSDTPQGEVNTETP